MLELFKENLLSKEMEKEGEDDMQPARFKPTISWAWGVLSTAVQQPLPEPASHNYTIKLSISFV